MKPAKKKAGARRKPGASTKHLSLYGKAESWEAAIGKAIKLPKPAEGWPKRERRKYVKKKAT